MKRLTLCILALFAATTLAGRASAQCDADFTFTTSASPSAFPTVSGNGVVTLLSQTLPVCTSCGSQIVLQNIATNSTDTTASPVAGAPVSYSSSLIITDTASGLSGTWNFAGTVSGSLSHTSSTIKVTSALTSDATQQIGCKRYTVTSVNVTNPGPQAGQPGGSLLGAIAATVTCETVDCTPTHTSDTIAPCYKSCDDAIAAALAATHFTSPAGCPDPTITTSCDGGCNATITVTATPACGNPDTATYHAKILDAAPTFDNLPAGGDLGCNPPIPDCRNDVTAKDKCGDPATVTCVAHDVTGEPCARTRVVTYTATDCAGNATSKDVTYTWKEDTTAPVIQNLPTGGNIEGCNPTRPTCATLTAIDNCDGTLPVNCSAGDVTGDCIKSQTFTYSVTDSCQNNTTKTVTYTWKEDHTPPVIDCPGNQTPPCNNQQACIALNVTANDNCDGPVPTTCTFVAKDSTGATVDSGDLSKLESSPGSGTFCFLAGLTYTITCNAIDSCNNEATPCVFTVIVQSCGGATRTQGFWSTRVQALCNCLPYVLSQCPEIFCGNLANTSAAAAVCNTPGMSEAEAIYWAQVGKTCDGKKRSALGSARLRLAGQLIAAYSNVCLLGTTPTQFQLSDACNALSTGSLSDVLHYLMLVDAFNNSGDNTPLTKAQQAAVGKNATPTLAKSLATGAPCPDPGTCYK